MCICLVVLANRLTVAVSDVLNPNIDDMSRGVGPLGYGSSQGDFSPQVSQNMCTSIAFRNNVGFRQKKRMLERFLLLIKRLLENFTTDSD